MAQQIYNSDFELSVVPNGQQKSGSNADSSGNWGFHGSAGVYQNGSKHNGAGSALLVPQSGSKAAFLFASNAGGCALGMIDPTNVPTMSQTFNVTFPTTYTLTFASAQQNTGAAACILKVNVRSADGRKVQDFAVTPGTSFAQTTIGLGSFSAQNYTLTFTAAAPVRFGVQAGSTFASLVSGMIFLDDVSVL